MVGDRCAYVLRYRRFLLFPSIWCTFRAVPNGCWITAMRKLVEKFFKVLQSIVGRKLWLINHSLCQKWVCPWINTTSMFQRPLNTRDSLFTSTNAPILLLASTCTVLALSAYYVVTLLGTQLAQLHRLQCVEEVLMETKENVLPCVPMVDADFARVLSENVGDVIGEITNIFIYSMMWHFTVTVIFCK